MFTFHRPETLREWVKEASSLRARLRHMPLLDPTGLRAAQVDAIQGLERSSAQSRARALVKVTGGAGKTYLGAAETYRLLKHAEMKRVLFLVDRLNLGRQAYDGIRQLDHAGRRPQVQESLYNIQLLRANNVDPAAARRSHEHCSAFYRTLCGEPRDPEDIEETSLFELEARADDTPVEVSYRSELPIEMFDFIWIDECHRSIYGKYGQVLDYFDSFKFGLSATPVGATYGYFDGNVVTDYTYEESVIDGINVDFAVYRIKTEITEKRMPPISRGRDSQGSAIEQTRKTEPTCELDDELTYDEKKLDRAVVAPDQIRTHIKAFRDHCLPEMFPGRSEVPKTLIFCKDDSHAEDVLKIVRGEFAEADWDFAQKSPLSKGKREDRDLIRDYAQRPELRIAVSVDQIATGTDIKAIECHDLPALRR